MVDESCDSMGLARKVSIGCRERDTVRPPGPREVPKVDVQAAVYCGPHGKRGRRLVAVVTLGRLRTDVEDIDWVQRPYDKVLTVCDRCPPGGADKQALSASALRQHLKKSSSRDVWLQDVLA